MKKTKLLGLSLITLMTVFSACTNDTEDVLSQGNEIKLTSEITPSRVTSLDYQSIQIVEGQQVGITIIGANKEHNNVSWRVEKNGLLTSSHVIYWEEEEITITAYHPFNANWTGATHQFSVSTDQSIEKNYLNSDLLWATTTASATNAPVPIQFRHKLAKINVTLSSNDLTDLSDATIYVCGTRTSTEFNPSMGQLSASENQVTDIKAGVTTKSVHTSSAVIIPQMVNKGTYFIKIVHRDKEYHYQLSDNTKFESGCSYNYKLNLKSSDVYLVTGSDFESEWV